MVFRMCASQTMDLSFHQTNSKRFVINGYLSTTHLHQGIPKATERQSKLSKLPRPSLDEEGKESWNRSIPFSRKNTPTQGLDSSPVQRLMNRRTKTLLPTTANLLKPKLCADVSRSFLQKLSCDVFQRRDFTYQG